jgi:hypothetical protein
MSKSLTLAELTALYANKGKPITPLYEYDMSNPAQKAAALPGSTTKEKLEKLFYSRQ